MSRRQASDEPRNADGRPGRADRRNGLGAAGVAPDVAIMPIRVLEPDLNGSARAIARGLRFAVDHGADVANLSIAGRCARAC